MGRQYYPRVGLSDPYISADTALGFVIFLHNSFEVREKKLLKGIDIGIKHSSARDLHILHLGHEVFETFTTIFHRYLRSRLFLFGKCICHCDSFR